MKRIQCFQSPEEALDEVLTELDRVGQIWRSLPDPEDNVDGERLCKDLENEVLEFLNNTMGKIRVLELKAKRLDLNTMGKIRVLELKAKRRDLKAKGE